MVHPVHPLRLVLGLPLAAVAGLALDPAATAENPGPARVAQERAVSSHVAELLAAATPKFSVAKPRDQAPHSDGQAEAGAEKPANGIVRLPQYVVREPRLPTRQEIMTRAELERHAMNRYLGPEDGFDRGVLNVVTLAGLWKKIPLIGLIPFVPFGSVTNEERAMAMYEEEERKRKMAELMGLAAFTKKSGDATGADKIKDETERTFIRQTDGGH